MKTRDEDSLEKKFSVQTMMEDFEKGSPEFPAGVDKPQDIPSFDALTCHQCCQ
jgi:hypothetical protein